MAFGGPGVGVFDSDEEQVVGAVSAVVGIVVVALVTGVALVSATVAAAGMIVAETALVLVQYVRRAKT